MNKNKVLRTVGRVAVFIGLLFCAPFSLAYYRHIFTSTAYTEYGYMWLASVGFLVIFVGTYGVLKGTEE